MTVATAPEVTARRLTSAPFLLLWSAQTASIAAEMFSYVALGWITLQLTGSGSALGAVLATQAIPRAVLMLVGGAISDRLSPIRVMIVSAAARAVVLGAFAAVVIAGRAQVWEVFLAAAALGVVGAFFIPARSSALPSVIDADLLEAANAWIFVATQGAVVVGPAVAGLLIAHSGTGPAFAIDAAGFAIASVGLLPLRGATATSADGRLSGALLSSIRDGLAYMWREPMLRTLLAVIVVLNFAISGPFDVGVTVLARQRWGGALSLGIVIAAMGVGSLVGAAATGWLRGRLPLGWAVIGVCLAFGLGFPLLGLSPSVWPAAALMAAMGAVNACVTIFGLAWMQRQTPRELLGRIMAVVMAASFAVAPLSFAIAGALVGFGTELLFALGGGLSLVVAAASFLSRTVRETA